MVNFWECIPIDKRGQAFYDLYEYQKEHYDTDLAEPDGLRGVTKREPDIINAPDYKEEEDIEIDREMRRKPHRPEKSG